MAILKAHALKKYRGERDLKVLLEWVNQVDHYISIVKLNKADDVRIILLLLEGDVLLWWRRNRKEFKKKGIST